MKHKVNLLPIIMVLVMILVAFATSCDKRNPVAVVEAPTPPIPPSQIRKIVDITASPETIYSDQGITFSTISVKVQDGEDFGVPGQAVSFKASVGRILTTTYTDSTGVARTTFWDDRPAALATPVTAKITAIVRNYSTTVTDSIVSADTADVYINIESVPPISQLTLELPSTLNPQPLNVMQSITVRARARNVFGNDVPDNTLISFSSTVGFFTDDEGNTLGDSVVVATSNGRATAIYNSGPMAGMGTIRACISDQDSSRNVLISPGRPAHLNLHSYVQVGDELVEADTSSVSSQNYIWMQAQIKDMYSNVVPGKPIKFKTNLGTFVNTNQEITTNSNENGIAQVRFTPGLQAGAATITAYANGDTLTDQLIFNIKSTIIHSIQFTQAGQIDLHVANTGGTESQILRVKLYDINGNLIDTPKNVYFKIMNPDPPAGANLNNQPASDSVLVVSSGGEAQVSVNSGTESGILNIRASCTSEGRNIRATKANIVIHSGPPYRVVPFASGFNTGESMGGGLWRIIAGANVYDVYNNPVDYGTSVWFLLPGDVLNCQIAANAYVGNESVQGDSTAGVAYTTLIYSGIYTFENLKIKAVTGGINGAEVFGEAWIVLPLNQPQLEVEIIPGNLVFHGNSNPNPPYATALINLSLFDQQGCAIHNARISMTSTRGEFIYTPGTNEDPMNCNSPSTPYIVVTDWYDPFSNDPTITPIPYTDINDNQDGMAQGMIKFYAWEIPLGDPQTNTPGITSVTITGRILGTGSSNNSTITLLRYPT
ncbi:MAG TPA: hypothetical protein PLF50_04330 [Candidatus Cloacimonadota bacterium]|nr:hypothetical protein [Candidatus Cloacimonadota bacterium]